MEKRTPRGSKRVKKEGHVKQRTILKRDESSTNLMDDTKAPLACFKTPWSKRLRCQIQKKLHVDEMIRVLNNEVHHCCGDVEARSWNSF
ncbi:hypothetical protein L1887_15294 [Cichorium endivia]|nr:hypothetical protein L1887_15294 [Cichorium endivia]